MLVQVDRGRTAIIVEDDSIMAEYVNEMLSLLDNNTFVCVDYESAKIFFDPQQTAVVVADIFTPGIGGIEGIKLVREALPDTHIIAMPGGWDGMTADNSGLAARKIGANAFLKKPFKIEDLQSALP